MRHRHLAACLALLGAVVAGCGSAGPGTARGGSGDPARGQGLGILGGAPAPPGPADTSLRGLHACGLAPGARAVIGRLFRPPYESPNHRSCFYEPAVPGGAGPDVILTLMERSGDEAAKAFSHGAATAGAITFKRVAGFGDDAYATTGVKGSHDYTLSAARGGRAVSISVDSTSPPDVQRVQTLMKLAITHL